MVILCSLNSLRYLYLVCLISLATSFMLEKILDVPQRHNSDDHSDSNSLDPEDQRNLSDPGWKHPNWREICRLQDSKYILRERFTIPRSKSKMPIPPKCGIRDTTATVNLRSIYQGSERINRNENSFSIDNRNLKAMYKDQEDYVVVPNDGVAQWDKFETLDELYAATHNDALALATLERLNPSTISDQSTSFRRKREIRPSPDKVPRMKSIAKDMARSKLMFGKVDDLVGRILNGQEADDVIQDDTHPEQRSFGIEDVDFVADDEEVEFEDFETDDLEQREQFDTQSNGENGEDRDERVIGGEETDEHEWPWLVAIGPRDFGQICGGTLISDRWVLTAAHCFPQRLNPCDYVVRLGEHNLNTDEEKHIDMIPSRIIVHEDFSFYTDGDPANDIALIQLSKPVKLSQRINAACLPDLFEFPKPGTKCTLVGWGFLEALSFDQLPNKPHGVEIESFSRETCRAVWGDIITKSMFCAGDLKGGKDACAGDSGGPLVCQNSIGKYELVGIVSFGRDMCGEAGFGGVYTLVSRYIGWMERMVKQIRKEDLYDARWWAEQADDTETSNTNNNIQNSLFSDLFTSWPQE